MRRETVQEKTDSDSPAEYKVLYDDSKNIELGSRLE